MDGCRFHCRTYRLYNAHVQDIHHCHQCLLYCKDRQQHHCPNPDQSGGRVEAPIDLSVFKEHSRAHLGTMRSYIHYLEDQQTDIIKVFSNLNDSITKLLSQLLKIYVSLRLSVQVVIVMQRDNLEDGRIDHVERLAYFKTTKRRDLYGEGEIPMTLTSCVDELEQKKNEFIEGSSNWYVKAIESVEIKAGELQLFRTAKANGFLKMPFHKKGVVNFKNTDKRCFMYCICAGLHWGDLLPSFGRHKLKNPKIWEQFFDLYDFSDVDKGEVDIYVDIPMFEEKNKIAVTVFSHKGNQVVLIRQSMQRYHRNVSIFLIHEDVAGEKKYHFALIRDRNKFLARGNSKKTFFCMFCFRHFKRERDQVVHTAKCKPSNEEDEVEAEFPEDWKRLKFVRPEMTLFYPYLLFYDFETFATAPEEQQKGRSTIFKSEFKPASLSLAIVSQGTARPRLIGCEHHDEGPHIMKKNTSVYLNGVRE